jgi:hypothetical protein
LLAHKASVKEAGNAIAKHAVDWREEVEKLCEDIANPALASKTRETIDADFTGMFDPLTRGKIGELSTIVLKQESQRR